MEHEEPDRLFKRALAEHLNGDLEKAFLSYKSALRVDSHHADSLHHIGVVCLQVGRVSEAVEYILRSLECNPSQPVAISNLAYCLHLQGKYSEAISYCLRAIKLSPRDEGVLLNLGNSQRAQGLLEDAKSTYEAALNLNPNNVKILFNLAIVHFNKQEFEQSKTLLLKVLSVNPGVAEAHNTLSACFLRQTNAADALLAANRAIELNEKYFEAWNNRGNALKLLGKFKDALESYEQAISLNSESSDVWGNYGDVLSELSLCERALSAYERALEIEPINASVWNAKANILLRLGRETDAYLCYQRAVEIRPQYVEALANLARLAFTLKKFEESVKVYETLRYSRADDAGFWNDYGSALWSVRLYSKALLCYQRAVHFDPKNADFWRGLGNCLASLKKHSESATSYLRASQLAARSSFDFGRAHHQMMLCADWNEYEFFVERINRGVVEGNEIVDPFGYQGVATSEKLLRASAEIYCKKYFPQQQPVFAKRRKNKKINIGYLCGEFRNHATSHLMAGVWEAHNKDDFEVHAFDSGWDDHSSYRQRIKKSILNFFDISRLSDKTAAEFISNKEIDILVNLNGYFGLGRQGVFAYKPAPIAINYLGFPGTLGAGYIDYLIADPIVIPTDSFDFYVEKIIHLPNCYQANDSKRNILNASLTREDVGLPKDAFVFCCFNNIYKITPKIFSLWMSILQEVESSCLWLLDDNPEAKRNLLGQAEKQGISRNRLIFAKRAESEVHLSRHRLADLFLDTAPYNAHTTASDALWAGLPILTIKGNTFPGRVAASLLAAMNIKELIARDYDEYKNKAVCLAKDPSRLVNIKREIKRSRSTSTLFDTLTITENIESAYRAVYERLMAGSPPDHIRIC